jgi:hypothetical protein
MLQCSFHCEKSQWDNRNANFLRIFPPYPFSFPKRFAARISACQRGRRRKHAPFPIPLNFNDRKLQPLNGARNFSYSKVDKYRKLSIARKRKAVIRRNYFSLMVKNHIMGLNFVIEVRIRFFWRAQILLKKLLLQPSRILIGLHIFKNSFSVWVLLDDTIFVKSFQIYFKWMQLSSSKMSLWQNTVLFGSVFAL